MQENFGIDALLNSVVDDAPDLRQEVRVVGAVLSGACVFSFMVQVVVGEKGLLKMARQEEAFCLQGGSALMSVTLFIAQSILKDTL